MPPGIQPQVELLTQGYGGVNNALQFSQIPREQSPIMQNAYMSKIGAIAKRPGSRPVTTSALAADIEYLTTYKSSPSATAEPEIYAASGVTLRKFNGTNGLTALTMTNNLNKADIYTVPFTDISLVSVLLIGDDGILKQCDGSVVKDVVVATDDPSPAPANELTAINAKGIKYVWEYNTYVFVSPGTNEVFFSKSKRYNYFPETNYDGFIRNNDFVNGCGLGYDDVMLLPLRNGWKIWKGRDFNDFQTLDYLNTNNGVIAPRSIQKVMYPDGGQTIIYLSDDEVHEVFTAVFAEGSKQYATRSLMKDKIDFQALGLTDAEKTAAVGFYDVGRSLYLLSFKRAGANYTYAYDLRNREWYTDWLTFNAKSYASIDGVTYFAGNLRHLCKFDKDLYSDWNEATMTTGTPVHFKRYTPLLNLEFSGYASYWDYYLIEARQFLDSASLDLSIVFGNSASNVINDSPWKLNVAVYGVSRYGEARYASLFYTDIVNAPSRKVLKKKAKYVQVLWENSRDEPLEIYKDVWLGRTSGQ